MAQNSLVNRESFFGGVVGARRATALPSWDLEIPEDPPPLKPPKHQRPLGRPSPEAASRPVRMPTPPPADPHKCRQDKLKANRDFSYLNESDSSQTTTVPGSASAVNPLVAALQAKKDAAQSASPSPGQPPRPSSARPSLSGSQSAPQRRAGPARPVYSQEHAATRRSDLPVPRARSMTPTGPSSTSAPLARSRPAQIRALARTGGQIASCAEAEEKAQLHKEGHSKPKIMAARGRKGAATRAEAFMPQSVGGMNRKAAATNALQQHIDSIRAGRPSPAPPKPSTAAVRHVDWRNSPALPPASKRPQPLGADDNSETDYDSGGGDEEDWRAALRSVTGYDSSRFGGLDDDRGMEASYQQMQAEERRSKRLGREEDSRAEAEEAAHAAAKAARKRQRPDT